MRKDIHGNAKIFSTITNMDITLKFSLAIIIGLVVLFALASSVILNQQETALDNMLTVSKDIETSAMKKQTATAKATVHKNAEQLVNLLKQTIPIPMAEFDIGSLQRYAKVIHQDSQISYVGFFNGEGKPFAILGDKTLANPENVIEAKVEAEGMYLGDIVIAYNLSDFEKEMAEIRNENSKNLNIMTNAKDNALSKTKVSFGVIFIIVALCIAAMIYYMFKFIVINRLQSLELRLKDISEGEGDLTQRISVQGHDSIDRVGIYFNGFLDTIHITIKQVASAVGQLSSQSEILDKMTDENKQDILMQKEQVEQAAAAITQMSASIREVAQNASLAAESAQHADEEAQNGNQVVSNTIHAINTLADVVDEATEVIHNVESDSVSIGAILDVIRGIAEQTNLLALNAAIEAARAGEQGRGFAVVADEVRTLAQRTQESTQEIQQMIERLQKGTSNAVGVMEQGRNQVQLSVEIASRAGESLRMITSSVSQIMDMNTQIASAAEEQKSVSEVINRNIISINTVSDKTTDIAQQTMISSKNLSNLSNDLQNLVGKFKV